MAETTEYTVTDISNALKGYVNRTRTAAHFDAPSFTAASKGTSEVVTKISQKRVRDSLQSIQRNAVVIRDNIAIVQSWANNVNEAPSMQDGLNAISCLTRDAADRHGAVR
ncbi:hypothetical protein I316_01680 [Kwoniella heveanensis BCC8398]|uniref:Uncharacterized protein n=1 Tax=Kwoniella heveanensis BCC8398 TaxID=1296120 RepID=A0A1B9GZI1_9TREE|nr:hypothetical protein I316_01680 [Kwoniella heveanensis BCC8398]